MTSSRMKFALQRNDSGSWGDDESATGKLATTVWRSTEVDARGSWVDDPEPAERYLDVVEVRATRLVPGDIVVTKSSGSVDHVGKAALVTETQAGGGFSNFMQRLRALPGQDPRYLWYLLNSRLARAHYEAFSTTTSGLRNLNGSLIASVPLPLVDDRHQRRLVDFLDSECERIAALLHALDDARLVAIESQRRATDDAFHSDMTRLGRLASVQTGLTLGGRDEGGDDSVQLPYLRVANVQADKIVTDDVATVLVPSRVAARTTLRAGDVLMTEGGDIDKLGRGAVWDGRIPGCLHQNHVFAVRCGPRLLPEVLAVWTRGSEARNYFEGTASRITNIASTNLTKLLRLPVPDLPLDEQRVRLKRFEKETTRLESLREELALLKSGLNEYRDALITEAVTGKLDATRLSDQQLEESARAAIEGEQPEVLA